MTNPNSGQPQGLPLRYGIVTKKRYNQMNGCTVILTFSGGYALASPPVMHYLAPCGANHFYLNEPVKGYVKFIVQFFVFA
jgi:hypothetical protein